MEAEDLRLQMRVKTNPVLGSTAGFLIAQKHLNARRGDATGLVLSYVPGHGGDVWFILHDDDSVGAYGLDEFEPDKGS